MHIMHAHAHAHVECMHMHVYICVDVCMCIMHTRTHMYIQCNMYRVSSKEGASPPLPSPTPFPSHTPHLVHWYKSNRNGGTAVFDTSPKLKWDKHYFPCYISYSAHIIMAHRLVSHSRPFLGARTERGKRDWSSFPRHSWGC